MQEDWETTRIRRGMDVFDRDGTRIGSVERVFVGAESGTERFFTLEKGVVFQREYVVPREAVRNVAGNRVLLELGQDRVTELPEHEGGENLSAEEARRAREAVRATLGEVGRAGGAAAPEGSRWAFETEEVRARTEEAERRGLG